MLKRIVKEGHSIGSMGYTPVDFLYANNSYIEEQIVSADEQFEKVLGYAPRLFLPLFGAFRITFLLCRGRLSFYGVLEEMDFILLIIQPLMLILLLRHCVIRYPKPAVLY